MIIGAPHTTAFNPGLGVARLAFTKNSAITPSRYSVELRDKSFRLKELLHPFLVAAQWEWNRFGGCGRATFRVQGDYLRFTVNPDDDVRVYLPNASSGTTLVYRGYVSNVVPDANTGNSGEITIECRGYFGWLDRVVVNDSGSPKVFSSTEVSAIVTSLVNSFIVGNAGITLGTVDVSRITPDTLTFKSSVREALRTLADLAGPVECGVGPDLVFYWYNAVETLKAGNVFHLGDKISKITDRVDYDQIVNKIFFEGGDVSGSAYTTSGQSQSSINRYGKHETIISNGSITTESVAQSYISSVLRQRSMPSRQLAVSLVNTTKRFEASLPIGAVAIVDQDSNQTGAVYGTTGAGGSNKLYGTTLNGGSGQVYGGVAKHQVERISYKMSPEDGRLHAEVQFGSSISHSLASARLKEIEQIQSSLRLRTL